MFVTFQNVMCYSLNKYRFVFFNYHYCRTSSIASLGDIVLLNLLHLSQCYSITGFKQTNKTREDVNFESQEIWEIPDVVKKTKINKMHIYNKYTVRNSSLQNISVCMYVQSMYAQSKCVLSCLESILDSDSNGLSTQVTVKW